MGALNIVEAILAIGLLVGLVYFFSLSPYHRDRFFDFLNDAGDDFTEFVSGPGEPWVHTEPEVNLTAPPVSENISYIARNAFEGVNNERALQGLSPLEWNSDLAYVSRLYCLDMAARGFFSHESPEGDIHDHRLHGNGIYYFNLSAENLAQIKHVSSYTYVETTGKIINKTYRSLDGIAEEAVDGWMNSTGHRENILHPAFDESGIGVAYDQANESFIFTQLFITRVHCGYRGASCCQTEGYLPWCYNPRNCAERICT